MKVLLVFVTSLALAIFAFCGLSAKPPGGSDRRPPVNNATQFFENALLRIPPVVRIGAFVVGALYLALLAGPQAFALVAFCALLLCAPRASAACGVLSSARDTQTRTGDEFDYPVAASTICYQGGLAAIDASGNAVPASNTVGLTVVGRFEETVDNSDGEAGDLTVRVRRGQFKFDNSVSNAIDAGDLETVAMVEDDETVATSASNSIKAGLIVAIDADGGIWIDTRYFLPVVGTVADAAVTAAKLADPVADLIRTTTCAVANTGSPDGVAHVTGQVKDAQGNALAGRHLVHVWFSATSYGAATDVGAATALANSAIITVVATDATLTVLTHTDGSWGVEYDLTVDGNLYAHATVLGLPVVNHAAITGN